VQVVSDDARKQQPLRRRTEGFFRQSHCAGRGAGSSHDRLHGKLRRRLKHHLTGRLALRFDARDVVGRYQATFANVLGVTGGIVKGRQTYNDLQLMGGSVFIFGGR
jgi:hypothetical protein